MAEDARHVESPLLRRLLGVRTMLRRRLVLYGVLLIGATGVFAFLGAVTLDWLLHLPGVLRVALGAALIVGLSIAMLRWIVRPLWAELSVAELAARLEQHFPHLNDRLASGVGFLLGQHDGSAALEEQVIHEAETLAGNLPVERALTIRPLLVSGVSCGVAVITLAIVFALAPTWPRIGASRFVAPFSDVTWPRRIEIVPLTGDRRVAHGDSVTLRMRIVRGADERLRGVVRLRSPSGEVTSLAMPRVGKDTYACTIDAVTAPFDYWFEAGDDSTRRSPSRVNVLYRPAVTSLTGRLFPPDYAPARPPVEIDLMARTVRAIAGSRLELRVQSTKPIGLDEQGRPMAAIVTEEGASIPLRLDGGERTQLVGTLLLERSLTFALRMVDADGLSGGAGDRYTVDAIADEPPMVRITEPAGTVEVTPDATVHIEARAEDDLGLVGMRLIGQALTRGTAIDVPVRDEPDDTASAGGRSMTTARHDLELSPFAFEPDEEIVYRIEATDNSGGSEAVGQVGRSAPMRLIVVGHDTLEQRLRTELGAIEERIRRAAVEQESLVDGTTTYQRTVADEGLTTALRDAVLAGASAQTHITRGVRDMARKVDGIARRMADNRVGDASARAHLEQVSEALVNQIAAALAKAEEALTRSANAETREAAQQALADARADQQAATEAFRRLTQELGQWGDFQEIVARTRGLLDRQQQVRASVVQLGEALLGQPLEALTDVDRAALRSDTRRQEMLTAETNQLLERMAEVARATARKDPTTSASLDEGLRAASAAEIGSNMAAAARAIAENRLAAARIGQRAAETGLTDVLAAFEARRARELARLAKTLASAEQAVELLLTQQRELLAMNEEALRLRAAADIFVDYGRRQHQLAGNAEQLAEDWHFDPETAVRSEALRRAAKPMAGAAAALLDADGSAARELQREAVSLLSRLLNEIHQAAEAARRDAQRQKAALIRAKLEALRGRQLEINQQTEALVNVVAQTGRLGRLERRKVSVLKHEQDDVWSGSSALQTELEDAVVYRFVLGRVLEGMSSSATAFGERRVDRLLRETQDRVIADLDVLLAALRDIFELKPPDEFADGGGGQPNGGNAVQKQQSVPALAELLVLKSMQLSLNQRTAAAAKDYNAETATEAQLSEVRALADEQQMIESLTRQVIKEAAKRER